MKRPPHNFVVEVRRQRRSTSANGKGWLAAPALALSERHAGAAALFEAERKPAPAAAPPPARPQGRILPSLVDIEPSAPALEEASAPPRRKRENPAAAAKPKTRAKKEASRKLAPPRVFQEPAVGWRGLDETVAAAGAKPARKIAKAEPFAARASEPEAVAAPEATLEKAPAERAGERQARHRRILDRYVLGAELKPGERWKKRLHKAR